MVTVTKTWAGRFDFTLAENYKIIPMNMIIGFLSLQ